MATAWATGVCLHPNRLEWTVLRRVKESWEVFSRGSAARSEAEGEGGGWTAAGLKPHLRQFKGRLSVALPADRVLMRVALLPSTDPEELRGMVELQADKFSPFPVETISLGAEVLDASETSSLLTMAVVPRDGVDAAGHPFQEAGAPPDVVDVELLGWWWSLRHGGHVPSHGSQIVLRSEEASLHMLVVRDGKPLLFRTLTPPGAEAAGGGEWVGECAEEMSYSLTALETEWGGAGSLTLHVFHAAGTGVGWAEPLREALGLEALFPHALEELATASEGIARRLVAPARPLAMDLAPEEWRTADLERRTRRKLLRSATVFLAVWLLAIGVFLTLLNIQRGRLARLQAKVEAMEGPAREVRRLRAKGLELAQYADRTRSVLECLRVVSETMPGGMDLNQFAYYKGNKLELRGDADASEKVYSFIQTLEQTGLFTEVTEDIKTDASRPGRRTTFSLTCRLPGAGDGES